MFCQEVPEIVTHGSAGTVWNDMDHAAGFREALGGLIQQIEDAGASFEPAQLYEITRHVTV